MSKHRHTVGWREWVALPELGLHAIKAKLDTGARTSALHAFELETFRRRGKLYARFATHPLRRRRDLIVPCTAVIVDRRLVTDSGGHREKRYVIESMLDLGFERWPIELTLTGRETMLFNLLIGRTAMAGRLVVDPKRSYTLGRPDLAAKYPTS